MRGFFAAARLLLLDLVSTVVFLILFLVTNNIVLSAGCGMAVGLAHIGIQLLRKRSIDTMGWLSLFLVVAASFATLITNDPRFVLMKPSIIYAIVGVVMLKPGWMNRYLPAVAKAVIPDVAVKVGFVWAALMFVTAALNAFVALTCSVATWALVMSIFGVASKALTFVAAFATMNMLTRRRLGAMSAFERAALRGSTA